MRDRLRRFILEAALALHPALDPFRQEVFPNLII